MKGKTILKIVLVVGLGAILVVGIFWVGKKFGERKEVRQIKTNQKTELEKQLQELKNQLQNETNPAKQPELEEEIKNLKQQIQNLGGSNNPSPPNPPQKKKQVDNSWPSVMVQ